MHGTVITSVSLIAALFSPTGAPANNLSVIDGATNTVASVASVGSDPVGTADRRLADFLITVYASDGGGTVSGGGTFAAGTSVTVHGTCLHGTHFSSWWDPTQGTVSYDADYTFTVTTDRTLYGSFCYRVTATANPPTGGFALGDNPEYGHPASVFASPYPGWLFLNWTEGGTVVST
ncbi:MAG TPA: hypothetical protein PK636_09590, partial [bacterium]|nr:hypothetical protein [bacterium]